MRYLKPRFLLATLVISVWWLYLTFPTGGQEKRRQRLERISPGEFKRRFPIAPKKIYSKDEIMRRVSGMKPGAPLASLVFHRSVGPIEERSPFIVRGVNFAARLTPRTITAAAVRHSIQDEKDGSAATKGNAIVLTFRGTNRAKLVGRDPLKGYVNSVIGNDRRRWLKKIPSFNVVEYQDLYPGVQTFVSANAGHLAYSFLLEPTANLANIRIAVGGTRSLTLDQRGSLVMETTGGPIVQTRPRFFDVRGRERKELKGRFAILKGNEYGFEVENHDPRAQLLIDPEIVFATYFGGEGDEGFLGGDDGAMDFIGRGFDITIGPNGHIYVIGMTASADFPTDTGGPINGSSDAFVMRIDPTQPAGQQLVYATFIGGSSTDRGRSVAPLEDGRVYISGHSSSADFPTSDGVVQPTRESSGGYIARLAGDGTFEIGSMIGRRVNHHPNGVVFSDDFLYLAGSARTGRGGAATDGSFQSAPAGGSFDGFLVKLDPELTRYEYFTYLGGRGRDVIMDLDVNDGFAFVTGTTASVDFPIPVDETPMQRQHSQADSKIDCTTDEPPRQCFDVFVTRFNQEGTELRYSTFHGAEREEYARGIAVTNNNRATITGAARAITGEQSEIFVTRFEGGAENFIWDLRLNAQGRDHGEELVVDQFGRTHFTGTISLDGLTTGLDSSTFQGGPSDIFYGRITNNGEVDYFSYLGAEARDRGFAIAAAGASQDRFCAMLAGSTTSDDIENVSALSGGAARAGGADLLLYTLCDVQFDPEEMTFTKTVSPAYAEPGSEVTFSLTVNNDSDTAVPVVITDEVPMEVTGVTGFGCTRTGNSVRCSFDAPPGGTTKSITARVGEKCPDFLENIATLTVLGQEFPANVFAGVICPQPLCPNGRPDGHEECDDGNFTSGDGCRPDCKLERCHDGRVDSPREQCDDGNLVDDDGCNNQCQKQKIINEICTASGPPCAGSLVCGKRCGVVEECDFLIFGCETYWLCQVDAHCMSASNATFIVGQ